MIHIYSKPSCTNCYKAKNLLKSKGIEFKESIIGIHIMRESFLEMFPNVRSVPYVVEQADDGFFQVIGTYEQLVEYVDSPSSEGNELLQG